MEITVASPVAHRILLAVGRWRLVRPLTGRLRERRFHAVLGPMAERQASKRVAENRRSGGPRTRPGTRSQSSHVVPNRSICNPAHITNARRSRMRGRRMDQPTDGRTFASCSTPLQSGCSGRVEWDRDVSAALLRELGGWRAAPCHRRLYWLPQFDNPTIHQRAGCALASAATAAAWWRY